MIDSCAFVAITTTDLGRARSFWVDALGLAETERTDAFFMVETRGLRLGVDLADGDTHRVGGRDPVVGLLVRDVASELAALRRHGIVAEHGPVRGTKGAWARLRDPDGHPVVLTESR